MFCEIIVDWIFAFEIILPLQQKVFLCAIKQSLAEKFFVFGKLLIVKLFLQFRNALTILMQSFCVALESKIVLTSAFNLAKPQINMPLVFI